MRTNKFIAAIFGTLLALAALAVRAELTVQITQGADGGIPIAIAPFGGQEILGGENLGSIISADLARSGRFRTLPLESMPQRPTAPEQVQFPAWQALSQDDLVIGQIRPTGGGQFVAQFHLFDAVRGNLITTLSIPFAAPEARKAAHRIADIIYQQLTGEAGAFATRVAYVTVNGQGPNRRYQLQVADTDGANPQSIITSREPIMSPSWSPDGRQVAYVSFENKTAAVFTQTLSSGERQKVSEAPGINGAPAWSPDGSRLAMTLSKDGNPDIYVMDLGSRSLQRITDHFAIDTEPSWSRDGRSILFTSDRGGKPQLYLVSSAGGQPQRVTYEGEYNARGVYSPDGKSIAMVHGVGGSYRIAVLDLANRQLRILTKGPQDESPGFAPNGSMILYAANGGQLAAVSIDGKVRQSLRVDAGSVRQPAWSP
ncbi:Tol-Pal system beta propeller repeat protein TolB [Methylococcus sp. EFPC2]|uniref:Tol-Pal system beta propeller repeat protein TolB n=1 Tax=Methylococcus sp. EFPC2 TaxID=2812648 RepID=UPI001967F478|nr:Tol-Pal system beta propeller repeat protein TolB [Methylococcus sp. EFPC2]QSA95796.1 Tol-Pal system beta propeller repeat protein TolB [Methylococcus sp. EFPC2]